MNINGKKLMDLGCPPGKAVGELLEQLLEECLQDRLENTPGQLEQRSQRMAQKEARMMERMFSISQVAQMLGLGIDGCAFMRRRDWSTRRSTAKTVIGCTPFIKLWSCWTSVITEVWD